MLSRSIHRAIREPQRAAIALFTATLLCGSGGAQVPANDPIEASALSGDLDLTELSLEDLLDIEVTVASRTSQSVSKSPAAVYVLTGDEIRRAGHSSVPEALRMVPGFYVSRWKSSAWDVTSRGFGTGLSEISFAYLNQLLVMVDGVVVYSPLFAGVWWPLQDMDVTEIDRIEIIRGPGGLLWGSNAVHGVVNIITKHSADTQGPKVSGRYSGDEWNLNNRYGGRFGETGSYRLWWRRARYDGIDNEFFDGDESWSVNSAGGRVDWTTEGGRKAQVNGRIYQARFGLQDFNDPLGEASVYDRAWGGSFSWSLTDPDAGSTWRASYVKDKQALVEYVDFDIDIVNVEYQGEWSPAHQHTVTWGLGYEFIHSRVESQDPFSFLDFDPESIDQHNARAFVLDTYRFADDAASLSVGLQAVHTEFEDFEVQPSMRLAWTPAKGRMLWSAISRAVRTPSIEEASLAFDGVPRSTPLDSESLVAFELGWREVLTPNVAVDLTAFYNDYDDQRTIQFDEDTFDVSYANTGTGDAVGAELAIDATLGSDWKLRSSYSYINSSFQDEDGFDLGNDAYHPRHIFSLRSYYDISDGWELDAGVYLVEGFGVGFTEAEYVRGDLRLGWQPSEQLEVSVGVQGLNDSARSEFPGSEVPRQWFLRLAWTP